MTAYTWTGTAGDGNFNNPNNWSPSGVPGAADTATIAPAAATAISISQNDTVGALTTNKFVTLNLANNESFTIGNGAATSFANSGVFTLNSSGNLTNLIVGGPSLTLNGKGTIQLGGNINNRIYGAAAADILNNVNNLIDGGGQLGAGQLTFTNGTAGVVNANAASNLVVNTGAVAVTNNGLLESTSTGGLVLQSTIANGTAGVISGAGGDVYLQSMTVQGGTVTSTGAGAVVVQGGFGATLDGSTNAVTNSGSLDVNNNGSLSLLGSIVNSGAIALQSAGNQTQFTLRSNTVTLSGGGTVTLSDNGNNYIDTASGTQVLDNVNNTIQGAGHLGNGGMGLTNGGTIDATGTGNRLLLNTGTPTTTNTGLIEATGAAGLQINSTVSNTGAGLIEAIGTGVSVSLDNGADIQGGTLATSGGGVIQVENGQGSTLDGSAAAVDITGAFSINNNGSLTVLGTIDNQSTIALGSTGNYTRFILGSAAGTLTGGGTLALSNNSVNVIYGSAASNVLTNLNNTITGGGQLGNTQLTLINEAAGIIDATAAGTGLVVNTSGETMVNSGLMEATTGAAGLVIQSTTVDNSGGGHILAAGANVYLDSSDLTGGTLNATGGAAIVVQNGQGDTLDGSTSAITNLGAFDINNNGSITLLGTLINDSTVALQSSGNYTRIVVGPGGTTPGTATLTGGGTLTLSDSSTNVIYATIGGDTLVNLNNTISGAGQLGNGNLVLINDSLINASGSNTLGISSGGFAVTNDGLMEATGTGGLVIQSTTISNASGTVLAAGGNVYLQSGTIAGGLINGTGGGAIVVQSSQAATLDGSASAITSQGPVDINNNGSLTVLGSLINDNTIALQSIGNYTRLLIGSPTLTLTGGGTITLSDSSTNLFYGAAGADLLDNVNNTITGAGQLGAGQMALDNTSGGTIIASGTNNALVLNTGSNVAINAGLVEATGAGGLVLQTVINNGTTGVISANGGNVYMQGSTIQGGSLTGGSAFVLQGSFAATLDGSANAITNSTTIDVSNNASLTLLGAIVNHGTLNVQSSGNYTRLLLNSATVTLSGGGTVALSDNANNLVYGDAGSDVLDNVDNTISGAGQLGDGQMMLVNGGTIEATGANALHLNVVGAASNLATGQLLGIGAGGLSIDAGTLTNAGLIQADDGSTVTFQTAAVLTNSANGTLTGGSYGAVANGNGATLKVTGSAIAVDAASIILSGAGSVIDFGTTAIDTSLSTIATGGKLSVLNGRNFTAIANGGNFADSGLLTLGGGIFAATSLGIGAGAALAGFGTVTGPVSDAGTIAASGGVLSFSGAVTGAGGLTAAAGATVDLTTGGALTEAISGAGTLQLDGGLYSIAGATLKIGTVLVDAGATLSGSGTLTGALAGAGMLTTVAGTTLDLAAGGSFAGAITGGGTLTIGGALTLNTGASLAVPTVNDFASITLGAGVSLTNATGDNFTLTAAAGKTIKLTGAAGDSFTNNGTVTANGAGTESIAVGFINTATVSAGSGTLSFLGTANNTGTIDAASGLVSFKSAVNGNGTLEVGASGTLSLLHGASTAQTIDFLAATGLVDLTKATTFKGTIDNFGGSNQIDLLKTAETGFGFSNGVLSITNGARTVASLHFGGSYTQSDFNVVNDGHGNVVITFT